MNKEIQEILKFVKPYLPSGYYPKGFGKEIEKHVLFNTFVILKDKENKIFALCRFNVLGVTAEVLDLFIREDMRHKRVIKLVTAHGWSKFPFLKFITYQRESKYPYRTPRIYKIKDILGV